MNGQWFWNEMKGRFELVCREYIRGWRSLGEEKKRRTSPYADQIAAAKKSMAQWPDWMKAAAHFEGGEPPRGL